MPIKLFYQEDCTVGSVQELQNKVNRFLERVEVIDVKFTSSGEASNQSFMIMVIYEKKNMEGDDKMALSKAQTEVVRAMKEQGLFLWTNEGRDYKAWLGDETGKILKRINRTTGNALLNRGIVKFTDGDYSERLYKYTLAEY